MSPEGTIVVDHVWKRFRVDRGRRLLRDHLGRAAGRMRGRTSTRTTGAGCCATSRSRSQPGEAVGIVGANGAGKSTLLKIISGLMFPHTGQITTEGQVGALIEVMSGIHSELTGRENINIYGNLLGLGRKEVAAKFDEIVAFAEIEDAIDRQVKFYSSGMKVRLGFAVAAFLEPRILIVDEVLAVGDSSFQQKCLERIRQVIQSGTTLLLVSHDLASVGAAATRGIWIADGVVRMDGPIDQTLAGYRKMIEAQAEANADVKGLVRVADVRVDGSDGRLVVGTEDCTVHLSVETDQERQVRLYLGRQRGRGDADLLRRARHDAAGGPHRHPHRPRPPAAPAPAVLPVVRRLRPAQQGRAHGLAADQADAGVGPAPARPDAAGDRAALSRVRGRALVQGPVTSHLVGGAATPEPVEQPAVRAADGRPLVSVLVPAYDVEEFVGAAIESALAQTYPHVEVVVVNDGSTDGTVAAIAPYRDRIVFVDQANRGLAGARNAAIEAASGTVLALLDADDLWLPDRLERCVRLLEEQPEVGLVTSDAFLIEDGVPTTPPLLRRPSPVPVPRSRRRPARRDLAAQLPLRLGRVPPQPGGAVRRVRRVAAARRGLRAVDALPPGRRPRRVRR